jgi:hypothetical protein
MARRDFGTCDECGRTGHKMGKCFRDGKLVATFCFYATACEKRARKYDPKAELARKAALGEASRVSIDLIG